MSIPSLFYLPPQVVSFVANRGDHFSQAEIGGPDTRRRWRQRCRRLRSESFICEITHEDEGHKADNVAKHAPRKFAPVLIWTCLIESLRVLSHIWTRLPFG